MGACQSISSEPASNSTSTTAITVKEKPAEEETKEEKPAQTNANDAIPTQQEHEHEHDKQSSAPSTLTESAPVTSTPEPEPLKPEPEPEHELAQTATPPSREPGSASLAQPDHQPISSSHDEASAAFDEEFKSTVKTILLLLLDRLIRTMEYESVMFQELALATGLPNYMELFDFRAFEQFLRDNFAIPSSPTPMSNDADVKHVSQYFSLFLSLAQNGTTTTSTRTFPSRVAFTERLQSLCSSTAAKLLVWCQSPHASSEVKEHFLFFSKALEFARGDLINQPKLLYQNIDEITA